MAPEWINIRALTVDTDLDRYPSAVDRDATLPGGCARQRSSTRTCFGRPLRVRRWHPLPCQWLRVSSTRRAPVTPIEGPRRAGYRQSSERRPDREPSEDQSWPLHRSSWRLICVEETLRVAMRIVALTEARGPGIASHLLDCGAPWGARASETTADGCRGPTPARDAHPFVRVVVETAGQNQPVRACCDSCPAASRG